MREDLDIVVTGFDVDLDQAQLGLIKVFGLDPARAQRFVAQLPVVAKRCPDQASADRYLQALRAIGAHAEARPHVDSTPKFPVVQSLPPPDPNRHAPRESLRVRSSAGDAIARFRAEEGLDATDSEPRPIGSGSIDPYRPSIPRAPAVPREAKPIEPSAHPSAEAEQRPAWMVADPLLLTPKPSGEAPESLRPPVESTVPPARRDSEMRRKSGRASESARPVGLAHAASATVRPGLSAHTVRQAPAAKSLLSRLKRWGLIAAIALVAALIALRATGRLLSEDERRVDAWRTEGIEAGEHAEANTWLEADGHSVRGLEGDSARELLEKLSRAGARGVYVVGIEEEGKLAQARGLVVEMPTDASARRTIYWHRAVALSGPEAKVEDTGESALLIELQQP